MKKIACIAVIIVLALTLFACAKPTLPQPTAEEILSVLTEKFSSSPVFTVKGKIFTDGVLSSEIAGVVDDGNKKIDLTVDGSRYLYGSRYLLKSGENGFNAEKADTSFVSTLSMLPFGMYDFKYNKNYRSEILRAENHIIITFLDKGVINTFNSSMSVSGGVFTITYDNDTITDTVLTTTLTQNGKKSQYSVHYTYESGGEAFESFPWVEPTDTLVYARYALSVLSDAYKNQTLHVASSDFNTGIPFSEIKAEAKFVKDVFVVKTDNNYSLNIIYSEKQIIVGISSGITEVQITFDTDYKISSVIINQGNRYYLK